MAAIRCYSARRTADGLLRRSYSDDEIDLFVAYCAEIDRCYALPPKFFFGRKEILLRLAPTRNKQKRGVNLAHRFEFEKVNWSEFSVGP